jgi:transglutaminase-like putative cysteine protease
LRKYEDWQVGETIDYKYYDLETFEITNETDIVREIDETFRDGVKLKYYQVETLQSDVRRTFKTVLSEDGTPLKYSELQGTTELEGEEQAKSDIRFGGFTFEDAVISVDQSIPSPEKISKITFEIVGAYDGGIYSGYQQRIFTQNQKTFLVLGKDIGSPEQGLPGDVEKNLKESSLYPIEDPAIQEMVEEVVGDVTDDWEKVKVLLDHVERYIVDDYTSNSMSVFEVLQKRKGDCSEHTLLFNTLARAAGIPTREVRGLINYEDRKFGLHAWNEVLVGDEWRSVDATWGYMATPLTHIKFEGNNYIPSSFDFRVVEVQ